MRTWRFREFDYTPGAFPLLMGIVNVTPDSFSDGGRFLDAGDAVGQAMNLVEQGADILDIGGESTRPGAAPVSFDEELSRVIPAITQLVDALQSIERPIPISIDTSKAEVARRAIEAGAGIVNDISGLTFDPDMPRICADHDVGVVCMHIRGTPQTMQDDPRYDDVMTEVVDFLAERCDTLESAGISRDRIAIDPGIGFGKTAEHNLAILSNIARFQSLDRPVLIGHSRKRFLQKVLRNAPDGDANLSIDEKTMGTVGVSLALAAQGVDILRVHDVQATRDALLAFRAVRDRVV